MSKYLKSLFLLIVFISVGFLCCACDKEKPFVAFSSAPLNENSKPVRLFNTRERIYFALVYPKGFKDGVIKVQIFKKDEKSEFWGYSYFYNREVRVSNKNYFSDYVVIHQSGHYIMQVFNISDLHKPIILGDFVVQE